MCKKLNEILKVNQPIFIGILLIIVVVLTIFLVANKSYGMSVQLGDKKITITSPNLGVSFREFGDSMVTIFRIETFTKPKEQEAYLDDVTSQIFQVIIDRHIELRKSKGTDKNCYSDEDYKGYLNITELCLADLKKSAIADFVRLDNINKQNEAEDLNLFIKNCIVKYISDYGELVKKRWSLTNITSDENYIWTRAIVPQIAEYIDDIFRQNYKIKLKWDKELEKLKSKTVIITSENK